MNREDLRARMRRLEELAAGLSREESLWRNCSAPVLAVDRQEYLAAIGDAIQGLEKARVTLAKMTRRMENDAGTRG